MSIISLMNLEKLKNKTILLFGKTRSFSADEFSSQLKFHKIKLAEGFSEDVELIIDGKLMTPYEQNESDSLYENNKKLEFISIDALERELAKHIDADTLMMSLKLSADKARLKDFLTNSMISDELYLKLIKMYNWGGENFFDNDDNRDISAALIVRFYKDIERNHNVEYAALGIMHLASQSSDALVLESIANLEPLHLSMSDGRNRSNYKIISSLAKNGSTPKSVLKMLIKKAPIEIKKMIAKREDCDEEMQSSLLEISEVHEALSYNKNLVKATIKALMLERELARNMARYVELDDELFETFLDANLVEIAQNSSLTKEMQKRILGFKNRDANLALASNEQIEGELVESLLKEPSQVLLDILYQNSATSKEALRDAFEDEKNHPALAKNSNTPSEILELLAKGADAEILLSLAKNPNTPVDILYQLQLDSRYERAVKENSNFGRHIMSENIGWQV
ncbi:MAG: hypothetical protein PHS42_11900 [Sulfurimonas sp.]|nr:hypothetical protein [Sulfurimonas sp.]